MSTEKNQSQEVKIETNIIEFPNTKKNSLLEEQRKEHAKYVQSICQKMDHSKYDQLPLISEELTILSNHGETIEFPKHIAARLISVLATLINHNSSEEFIWEKKEKVMFV